MSDAAGQRAFPNCVIDGVPTHVKELPVGVAFVGMEKEPNRTQRYKRLTHPWFNLPCYESISTVEEAKR